MAKNSSHIPNSEWDLRAVLLKSIADQGGWVNAHTHLDRSYTITTDSLSMWGQPLQKKWELVDHLKRKSSVTDIYDRMAYALEYQLKQGVTALASFIDVDAVVEDKAIQAAQRIKDRYGDDLELRFVCQTLKGVIDSEAREWFERGAEFVDILGGLPGKDHGHEEEHLDIVLGTAKKLGKMAHIHVDQLNTPAETETELLVRKTHQYELEGRVAGIHGISIASHPQKYRLSLYEQMHDAGLMMIACPTAWIDHQRQEELQPVHNAVTPAEEMGQAGVVVALGTDNIADIYKPFTRGDMWTELRFLLETLHLYDLDQLVAIASSNGRKVLGISE